MFNALRQNFSNARVLAELCKAAESEARRDGQTAPGAEHFVLAALSLPDGRARRVWSEFAATEEQLREAIAEQYKKPLQTLGLAVSVESTPLARRSKARLYRAAPSGQGLVQTLSDDRRPLTSDRVLVAALERSHGVFPRALKLMGLDLHELRAALQSV